MCIWIGLEGLRNITSVRAGCRYGSSVHVVFKGERLNETKRLRFQGFTRKGRLLNWRVEFRPVAAVFQIRSRWWVDMPGWYSKDECLAGEKRPSSTRKDMLGNQTGANQFDEGKRARTAF